MKHLIISVLIALNLFSCKTDSNESEDCEWIEVNTYSDLNPKDVILLAKLVNSESAGESMKDKLSVASVVVNRMNSDKFPNTIKTVVYEKRQFSGINGPNFKYNRFNEKETESIYAALHVLKFGPVDSTVLFFHNPGLATDAAWVQRFAKKRPVIRNENHVFFSEI